MAAVWSRWLKRWSSARRTPTARRPVRPTCHRLEARETPADLFSGGINVALGSAGLVAGAGAGGAPMVAVHDPATGALRTSFLAFDAGFSGGVNVAAGADGNIIAGAGAGGSPIISVFDAAGRLKSSFLAFDKTFGGGVRVAYADVNGDGTADVIAAAGPGSAPQVKVFSGTNFSVLRDFGAFFPAFTGGVTVAAADLTGDGRAEIVVGAGSGGVPLVSVFDGASGQQTASFLAFDRNFNGGVTVAATAANGGQIVVGASAGGVPVVCVYNEAGTLQRALLAFDQNFSGGALVAAGSAVGDATPDVVTGAGAGGVPVVRVFNGATNISAVDFLAFQSGTGGGGGGGGPTTPPPGGDTVAPTVTITGPALNQTFSTNPTIQGTVNDNVAVTRLEAQVDNAGPFVPVAFGGTGTFSFVPAATLNGRHSVAFRAFDAAGNVSPVALFAYTLQTDTVVPTVTITSPAAGQTFTTNPTITGTAADNVGVTAVEARVDSGAFTAATFNSANGTYTFTPTLPTDGSADGSHTVEVRSRDVAGNVSTLASVTFTLDSAFALTVGLAAASDTGTAGNNITENATVTLTGITEANAQVALVGGTVTTTADASGNYSLANVPLTTGQNVLTVRATLNGETRDANVTVTLNVAPTAPGVPANFTAPASTATVPSQSFLNLPQIFSDADVSSLVRFNTNFGSYDIELFDQQVGTTVANFLKYVGDTTTSGGDYNNTIFHRKTVITTDVMTNDGIAVLQGGGYQFTPNPGTLTHIATDAPITLQDLLTNSRGTISMARTGNPNSGTSEFFLNTADNKVLDRGANPNNPDGYAVFGAIRAGQSVVDAMYALTEQNRGGAFSEIPLQNYPAGTGNFPADTTSANYAFVNSASIVRQTSATNPDALTFSVVNNSNPTLATATISNGKLTLSYAAGQTGQVTITVRATDRNGVSADATFTVTVGGA